MTTETPSNLSAQQLCDAKHDAKWVDDRVPLPWVMQYIQEHRAEMGERLLDVGCGPGNYTIPLAQEGFDMTGYDVSPVALQKLQSRLRTQDLPIHLVQGSFHENLPFDDGAFDSALSIQVLNYGMWADIQHAIQEVRRVLRDGGYFLWRVRSKNNDNHKKQQRINDVGVTAFDLEGDQIGWINHQFAGDEMHLLAKQNDFEVVLGPFETKESRHPKPGVRAHWNAVYRKQDSAG
ncbi:MAG: class I SAM-dependent methyltransferase [Candidatus Peribacteraceae bacterium]|jgi:SAM-dependent methyltransferase